MKSCSFPGLVVPLLLLSVAGCSRPAGHAPPPPVVSVAQPLAKEVTDWDEYTGRLEAPETIELRARVSGYLEKVHFKEGKDVKKGDLLFTIDARPYRADYERAAAEHRRAQSQADLAKNEFDRASRLMATKVISEEDFDAKAKALAVAQAQAGATKAAADASRLNLEFTEIHATIDGRIGRALVTEGNLVSSASLLTTLVSLDPLYCYVDVDERSILKYIQLNREGKRASPRYKDVPVEMALVNESGYPHVGYADFVDNRIDPATGTMRARGVFRNEDHSLSPGFFARLRVPGSAPYAALLIPDRALGSDQAQKFVYVVGAEQKVEFRPVTIGPRHDGLRVISAGLKPDDRVIVEGLMRVRPGVVVDPKPYATP